MRLYITANNKSIEDDITIDNDEFYGDIVEYEGKRYFVSLEEERVEFISIVGDVEEV